MWHDDVFSEQKLPRSYITLKSFVNYCREHPEERFWQALRNWSGHQVILADDLRDTFYWEGRDG